MASHQKHFAPFPIRLHSSPKSRSSAFGGEGGSPRGSHGIDGYPSPLPGDIFLAEEDVRPATAEDIRGGLSFLGPIQRVAEFETLLDSNGRPLLSRRPRSPPISPRLLQSRCVGGSQWPWSSSKEESHEGSESEASPTRIRSEGQSSNEKTAGGVCTPRGDESPSIEAKCRVPTTGKHAFLRVCLKGKQLTSVDLLRTYPFLENIDVSENALRDLDVLGCLVALRILLASHNQLLRPPRLVLPRRLEVVDLSYNSLSEIGNWCGHPFLRELSVRGNWITCLGESLVTNTCLRRLDVSENGLEIIDGIDHLPLVELYLSANKLRTALGIRGLYNLRTLDLSHNFIDNVDPINGSRHPFLLHLQLAHNQLSCMYQIEGFADMPLLRSLFLSPSPLESLPHYRIQVLSRIPHIASLDGQPVSPEELVDSEVAYGHDLNARRKIWESYLPGEPFVDRRILTPEMLEGVGFLAGVRPPSRSSDTSPRTPATVPAV